MSVTDDDSCIRQYYLAFSLNIQRVHVCCNMRFVPLCSQLIYSHLSHSLYACLPTPICITSISYNLKLLGIIFVHKCNRDTHKPVIIVWNIRGLCYIYGIIITIRRILRARIRTHKVHRFMSFCYFHVSKPIHSGYTNHVLPMVSSRGNISIWRKEMRRSPFEPITQPYSILLN